MYSPDGFASLACVVTGECFFLVFQAPFVKILELLNGNYYLFFLLQAIIWFALIGVIYFLCKELKVKHLFLTPFLLLFSTTLFVDNYVGSLENDYVAIILFLLAIIFYLKNKYLISLGLVSLGTSVWFWVAYLFRIPVFLSNVAEEMWWVQIGAWGAGLVFYLLGLIFSLGGLFKKEYNKVWLFCWLFLLSFVFPKLWFFSIPVLVIVIDFLLEKFWSPKFVFYLKFVVFALIVGQMLRVGFLTHEAWNYPITDSNCYLVNHEYLARIEGKSLNYNQVSLYDYNECLKSEGFVNGIK